MTFSTSKLAGITSILAAILYTSVFTFLAIRFNYPDILDVSADEALPNLISMGDLGRAVWAIYALIPLLWVFIAVGTFEALREYGVGRMRVAKFLAFLGGITGTVGLARWATIQWTLGQNYTTLDVAGKQVISALFEGLNVYLGQFIGEFVSEMSWSLFFVITGFTLISSKKWPLWFGYLTIFTGFIHLIAMFRNVWPPANNLQDIINTVLYLPLFLILFGVMLIRGERNKTNQQIA